MESRIKVFGHPLHVILIVFPLGLLATAAVFDVIFLATRRDAFALVAWYMIAAGVIGGLLAAPAGLIDWLAIPTGTRARRIGALHGLGNVVVLALFAASWLMRRDAPAFPATAALVFSFAGVGLAGLTGWLGGELVNRLGVGVDDGAHLDAPSSLSGPARRVGSS
jgi:uncharacterized membrane protein